MLQCFPTGPYTEPEKPSNWPEYGTTLEEGDCPLSADMYMDWPKLLGCCDHCFEVHRVDVATHDLCTDGKQVHIDCNFREND